MHKLSKGSIKLIPFSDSDFSVIFDQSKGILGLRSIRDEEVALSDRWENALHLIHREGLVPEIHPKIERLEDLHLFFERHDDLNAILSFDHLERGNPEIRNLGKLENVALKLLIPEISYDESRDWILDSIDQFGSLNVMFGKTTKNSFAELQKILDDFSDTDKQNLFSNSASKWYKLDA